MGPEHLPRTERPATVDAGIEQAFAAAPFGIGLIDDAGRWRRVNGALCAALGRTEADLVGQPFEPSVHEDDAEVLAGLAVGPAGVPLRLRHLAGTWVRSAVVVSARSGELLVYIEDGGQTAAAVIERLHLDRILNAIVEYVYTGEVLADGGYQLVFKGPCRERFLGLAEADAEGAVWADFVHADDREAFDRLNQEACETGRLDAEYRLVGADGIVRWVRDRGRLRRAGGRVFIDGSILDVSERRLADDALREERRRFRIAFDQAPIGIGVLDLDGSWVEVNDALCELLDRPRVDVVGRSFAGMTHPDDADADVASFHAVLAADAFGFRREKRFVRPDGQTVHAILSITKVPDAEGGIRELFVQVVDVSERHRTAVNLAAVTEAMREVSRSGAAFDTRRQVCRAAATVAGAMFAVLWEPDGPERLRVTATHGQLLPVGTAIALRGAASGVAVAFRSRRSYFSDDVSADLGLDRDLVQTLGAVSAHFEPILRDGAACGVLVVAWRRRVRPLAESVAPMLQLIAVDAGIAMERADLLRQLDELARTDALTGWPNRRDWDERLPRALSRARRSGGRLCVALMDVDGFKTYNDTHGHQKGDRLLAAAAQAWGARLRGTDTLVRYGGDEFAAVLPSCSLADARLLVDQVRSSTPRGERCSAGVAEWDGTESAEALVARADAALYRAKRAGRDRTEVDGAEPLERRSVS